MRDMESLKKRPIPSFRENNPGIEARLQNRAEMKRKALFKRLMVLGTVALMFVLFFTFSISSQRASVKAKEERRDALKEQLAGLEKEGETLQQDINKLNDNEYIAKLARKKFLYSKPGETIFPISE